MNNAKISLYRSALRSSSVLVAAATIAMPALAQEQEQEAATAEEVIIVTGSLIQNPNLERSSPVNVTTADEIELLQSNVAEDILRDIPGIVPNIGSAVNNGNGGASYVDLRGLGSNRNIVILDGQRLAPSTLVGRFDLNNVPVALVERVDVLTGGSSTTYGADAISGVVNFITKQDFAGAEFNVSNQITEEGDGNYFRADATIGANFDDGRGNVVLSVGYQESDPVYQGSRAFSYEQVDSFNGSRGGSGTSVPTRFSGVDPIGENNGGGTRQVDPANGAFLPTAAYAAYNFNPLNIFQTPFERFNIYGSGRYELSDAVEVYSRAIFSKNTVSTIIAPSGVFGLTVAVPLSSPFLTPAMRNAFCAFDTSAPVRDEDGEIISDAYVPRYSQAECDAAAVATDPDDPDYRQVNTVASRRAVESGPRISDFTTTFFDYSVGFRGGITDTISWNVRGAYGESENIQVQQGYWLNSRVRQALLTTTDSAGNVVCQDSSNGCVPLNLFGAEGSVTPEMNAFLGANSQVAIKTSLAQLHGMINGDLGWASPAASEPIAFAIGGEYRKYTASQESDLLSQSGDLGGAGGAAPNVSGGYDVYEAIGEIIVPLVQDRPFFQNLTVEAGIRYSKYSVDAPTSPSYKTTTWKAGGTWEPGAGVSFRGNYARSVRAPNISELFSPLVTGLTNLSDDPCANLDDEGTPIPGRAVPSGALRDVCIAQGAPAGMIGSIGVPTAGQANVTSGGNLDIKPEKSNSYTIGVVLQPEMLPAFSLSVDYYNIKIKDAVSTPTPGDVMSACFDNPSTSNPACLTIRRSELTGSLSGDSLEVPGLYAPISNLGKYATDGIDFNAQWRGDVGFAELSLGLVGNYTFNSKFQATPTSVNRDCVGLYSVNCQSLQPKLQWTQRTTLSFDVLDVSLLWRHIDSMKYEDGDAYEGPFDGKDVNYNKIKAYDYFDLTTRAGITDNISLTFTIQNLFNKKPPIVGNTLGATAYNSGNTYPSTYDALGRRYGLAARLKF